MSKVIEYNDVDGELTQISKEYWKSVYRYRDFKIEVRYHTRGGMLKVNTKYYKSNEFFWSTHFSEPIGTVKDSYGDLEMYVETHHESRTVQLMLNALDLTQ